MTTSDPFSNPRNISEGPVPVASFLAMHSSARGREASDPNRVSPSQCPGQPSLLNLLSKSMGADEAGEASSKPSAARLLGIIDSALDIINQDDDEWDDNDEDDLMIKSFFEGRPEKARQ